MKDPLHSFLAGLLCVMTIQKAKQIYLDWKESHTNVAYSRYNVRLEAFIKSLTPTSCLQDITGDDVIRFHKSMEFTYSKTTIAYSARILKNFFWFWHGRGMTNLNPKEIIPIRFITADKEIVTKEDFEDLNDVLDVKYLDDLQKKLVLNLLWDTGMRVSELLELKLADISSQGVQGLRTAKIRSRKTMRYNLVVWGSDTNDVLNRYLGIRLCMEHGSEYLLLNKKTGKRFTPRTIQRWIKDVLDLAGIDKEITPHSFRHGKANEILEQGGNVRDVSAILRHINPQSSFHYLQLSQKRYLDTAGKYLKTV